VHGRRYLVSIAVALVLASCAAGDAPAQVRLTEVGSFASAMYVTSPPGDSRRLFVVEQGGTIQIVRDGVKLDAPFLDIDPLVMSGGEQGLLSMAFAPDYATSRKFYVYYTGNDGNNHVAEFLRSATDLDRADPATARGVLSFAHPTFSNHNGGQLQFGPDGYLYIGTGDGGSGNDPPNNAQNKDSLLGKLLRIDPSVPVGYAIPPGNPFVGVTGARPEVWSYGLRNPWRFSFDRQTADLTIGDVGQNAREEVDFSPAGAGRGAGVNYGWRCWEGTQKNTNITPQCDPPDDVFPVLEQPTTGSFCAIVGGYVVRDPALTGLTGRYIYGDNCEAALRSAVLSTPTASDDRPTGHSVSGLTSFGEDACGRLYAVSFSAVRRFDGTPPSDCNLPDPYPAGSGQPSPPSPDPGPTVDTLAPEVVVSRRRVQRILRQRGVVIGVACNEACTVVAGGTISVPGAARVFRLRRATRTLAAGVRARIKVRITNRTRRPLRRALIRGRRVRARVNVRATDLAGNARSNRKTVRARR
jgi:Glucose / Sorbosone dehydrogenase